MKFRSAAEKARYLEAQKSWDSIVKSHLTQKPFAAKKKKAPNWEYKLEAPVGRATEKQNSRVTSGGVGSSKEIPRYTGTAVKGISTMHKSSLVPVFDFAHAKEIASMRR